MRGPIWPTSMNTMGRFLFESSLIRLVSISEVIIATPSTLRSSMRRKQVVMRLVS